MIVMADGIPVKKRWKIDFSSKCSKNVVSFVKPHGAREKVEEESEAQASPSDLAEELLKALGAGEKENPNNNSGLMPEEEEEEEEEALEDRKETEDVDERLAIPEVETKEEPAVEHDEERAVSAMETQKLPPPAANPHSDQQVKIARIPVKEEGKTAPETVTVIKAIPRKKPKKKVMVTIQTYNSESEDEPVKMRPQRRSKPSMMDLRDQHRVFNTTSFMKETPLNDAEEGPEFEQIRHDVGAAAAAAPDASPPLIAAPVPVVPEPSLSRIITSSSDDTEDGLPLSQFVPKKPTPAEKSLDDKLLKKVKKKKLKKKKKKDPHEPQKPVSAYALFFRDMQSGIKAENPDASFGEISKIVAYQWDSLDENKKTIYKKKTETAKKDYLKKLAAYRANSISSEVPDAPAPERSPPGFAPASISGPQLYENSRRPEPAPVALTPGEYEPSILSTKPGICVNDGCTNLAIEDTRWDREYCSTECVVQHCREAFQSWVLHRQDCAVEPQTAAVSY